MDAKRCMLIYYLVVIGLIGIPIWYKTTSPVRYRLPDVKSLMVHSQRLVSRVQVNVIDATGGDAGDSAGRELELEQMKEELENNWSGYRSEPRGIIYEFQWIVRKLKDDIEDTLFSEQRNDLNESDELTKQLKLRFKQGNLSIYVLAERDWQRLTGALRDKRPAYRTALENVIYGSYRSFYVRSGFATSSSLAELVQRVLDNQLSDEALSSGQSGDQSGGQSNSQSSSQSTGQSIDVLYSKPELIEAKIPKNVESSLMNLRLTIYLNIMTEQLNDSIAFQQSEHLQMIGRMRSKFLSDLAGTNFNLNVISQMINNALPDDLIRSNLVTSTGGDRLLDLNCVPDLLNRIESRISPPSDKHTLEFNLIVPSSPLYFFDRSTGRRSNAIVTPYQPNTLIWNAATDFNIGFKSFVRKQLGLPFKQPAESLRRDLFFAKWEFDNLVRQITVKQLTKTLESLESLEKLLNKISNIVIEEKISKRMFAAIDYAHRAIDELENYGLSKAFEFSSKAFQNSENAYYDPSLLSLLYFPEDQKYAIYFPLFFPIAIQLGSYLVGYVRHRHSLRRAKKSEQKKAADKVD